MNPKLDAARDFYLLHVGTAAPGCPAAQPYRAAAGVTPSLSLAAVLPLFGKTEPALSEVDGAVVLTFSSP